MSRALRLECRADRMPADWLDDNLRCGDALVGLDRAQIISFDWRRGKKPLPWLEALCDSGVRAAAVLREERLARLAALARVA